MLSYNVHVETYLARMCVGPCGTYDTVLEMNSNETSYRCRWKKEEWCQSTSALLKQEGR